MFSVGQGFNAAANCTFFFSLFGWYVPRLWKLTFRCDKTRWLALRQNTNLQVVQGELASGFLVELQGDLQLVQLFPEASKLLEVII